MHRNSASKLLQLIERNSGLRVHVTCYLNPYRTKQPSFFPAARLVRGLFKTSNTLRQVHSESMGVLNFDGRQFRSAANTDNGEVGADTIFHYHQQDKIVWAEYSGGSIVKGSLIATVQSDNTLDMRYQHVNKNGDLMTGQCLSKPEELPDGRLRMHERWQWTSGDRSQGESVVEEVQAAT